MRLKLCLLSILCWVAAAIHAQDDQPPSLNIGDSAPPLRVHEWLKGEPVQQFEKGKVYVIEFWATWCAPCKAEMPYLSALAAGYKGSVSIIGVDIYETKGTSMKAIKAFVAGMGERMNYNVAAEDSIFMERDWLDASGEQKNGIPRSFVIDRERRLAWIGHPKAGLEQVLPKIVDNTWDLKEELARRNSEKRIKMLDDSANWELKRYFDDPGKPDSALLMINELVKSEPKLKYAPHIVDGTFSSLLRTDAHKAYEYGKAVIKTSSTFSHHGYDVIIDVIEWNSDKLSLPAEIYQLGAEAYQKEIGQIPYPEIVDMPGLYSKMAAWYMRANDKSKAINAQREAIKAMKSRAAASKAALKSQLKQYKNR